MTAWVLRAQTIGAAGGPLVDFTEGEVAVTITYEPGQPGQGVLVARFEPTREGFHLYSKDLPRGGLGFPTLLEVIAGQGIEASGGLSADQPETGQFVRPLGANLPVYPPGPVTLRLPVTLSVEGGVLNAELSVTYAACSASTCLTPVVDKRIEVAIQVTPG
jgi:hypothetical protein